jgi:hypothetical protein
MSPLWPLAHIHGRSAGAPGDLKMRPTTTPSSSTSKVVVAPLPEVREAEERQGHRSSASARRPASVIRMRVTLSGRPPATIGSALAVARTGADQLGQHLRLEAVGQNDRLGAAVGGRVEQFERPAPVALGAAGSALSGCRHLGTRAAALRTAPTSLARNPTAVSSVLPCDN